MWKKINIGLWVVFAGLTLTIWYLFAPPRSLEKVKTVDQAMRYLGFAENHAERNAGKDEKAALKCYYQTCGELRVATGERILAFAKNDEEINEGYIWIVDGLARLVRYEDQLDPSESDKGRSRQKLDALIDELEQSGKHPKIVNTQRTRQLFRRVGDARNEMTRERFDEFLQEAKTRVNFETDFNDPAAPVLFLLEITISKPLSETEPELCRETAKNLIDFVRSDQCKFDEEKKKKTIKDIEGIARRHPAATLELYGRTIDGKEFQWEEYSGKYVLVEFTASWCGPCRMELPNLLEAYNKYHEKGLEVVAVGVSDENANLLKMAKEDKLPWAVISEELTEKAGLPKQGEFFGINGVPTILLINRDGKLIDSELRGEDLQKRLAELLDEPRP